MKRRIRLWPNGPRRWVRDPSEDVSRVRALIRRADDTYAALWSSPGGFTDKSMRPIADLYRVAADAAEETGFTSWARDLRGQARRFMVVDWARQRWPWAEILPTDIHALTATRGGEVNRFLIGSSWEVRMDRRGRVRIMRGATR